MPKSTNKSIVDTSTTSNCCSKSEAPNAAQCGVTAKFLADLSLLKDLERQINFKV